MFTDQINDILNKALRDCDFRNLNWEINDAVRRGLYGDIKLSKDDPGAQQNQQGQQTAQDRPKPPPAYKQHAKGGFYSKKPYQQRPFNTGISSSKKIPVNNMKTGSGSGLGMMIGGLALVIIFGITMGTLIASGAIAAAVTGGVFTALGAWLTGAGAIRRGLAARFKEYLQWMNDREFCEISELAAGCGRKEENVRKDLRKMIRKGMFPEGHIDSSGKWFIANNRMYETYLDAQGEFKSRKQAAVNNAAQTGTPQERQLREVLAKGDESIKQIRDANVALPGEEISRQLDTLEDLIRKIFKRVEEKPSLLPDIRKFMDYYLPTTVKLVNVYRDMESKGLSGDNAVSARKEIEETLKTIQGAFERLLNELYDDTVMDVKSDISVLNTMFAKDGLTGDELTMQQSQGGK